MEPLGATASIISVLQLSEKVIQYIKSAKGAKQQRTTFRDELRACEAILRELKDEADDSEEGQAWTATIETLEAPESPLSRLYAALSGAEARLRPRDGVRGVLSNLQWPFSEKEVKEIFKAIEREKTLLQLALANNSRKLLQEIKRTSTENSQHLKALLSQLNDNRAAIQSAESNISSGFERISLDNRERDRLEERSKILDWLTQEDYAMRQIDVLNRRHPGTGQWLLEHSKFQRWLGTERETFFCPGIPGAGKTTLTSIVIEDLLGRFKNDKTIGLAFIYCDFRRHNEQTPYALLMSLLRQLVQGHSRLPGSLTSLYETRERSQTRPTYDEVKTVLYAASRSYSRVFIVVDALDELAAAGGQRHKFLTEILTFQAKCGANLFTTTRFIPDIMEAFDGTTALEIQASEHDVRAFLTANVSHLPSFVQRRPDIQEEVVGAIVSAVDGMFLLARLHLESLFGKRNLRALRAALDTLPTGCEAYDDAYHEAMKRIEGQVQDQVELAKQVLSWLIRATRLLSITELQHALAVEEDDTFLDLDDLPDVADIISCCAGLVTVDEGSGVVRLVHYTTQEYFAPNNWGLHAVRAKIVCQHVLDFLEAKGNIEAASQVLLANPKFHEDTTSRIVYLLLLKNYYRLDGVHQAAYFGVGYGIRFLLETGKVDPNAKDSRGQTPLILAARAGHEAVVKLLLGFSLVEVDAADEEGFTPLSFAAMEGHEAIVKQLLETGNVNVNSVSTYKGKSSWARPERQTPLSLAAAGGHIGVVNLILETGEVDVNSRSRVSLPNTDQTHRLLETSQPQIAAEPPQLLRQVVDRTPLSRAVEACQEAMVQMLLDRKAEVNSVDNWGYTPLTWAVRAKNTAMVRMLLDANADVNLYGRNAYSPLTWALKGGWREIERMLLDREADVNSVNNDGRTPLSWAAEADREAIVQMLLDREVDVNSVDNEGRTPLSWAAESGNEKAVQVLLDRKVDVNSVDNEGRTPLSWAAEADREAIVQMLLDREVDVNSVDKKGLTPLSWAAGAGNKAIVQILLERNADVNSIDKNGRTPLLWAAGAVGEGTILRVLMGPAQSGYLSTVRLLLSKGLDASVRDKGGATPLMWATRRGYKDVLQELLNYGVDADARDEDGRTPLSHAVGAGYEAIVELLLSQGVDIEAKDCKGRTPLSYASAKNYRAVEILVRSGASVDARDDNGRTALSHCAARSVPHGYDASIVKLLLDSNAEVDSRDNKGRTPLSYAVEDWGNASVVRVLLANNANVHCKDDEGRSISSRAAVRDIEELLLEAGAEIKLPDDQ